MTHPLQTDPAFLRYYAGVLEREAAARPKQNVVWMTAGAQRAREQAERREPGQGELAL